MRRKLIKQGIGGHTIYLPKEWVDQHGLKQGVEVDILPVDDQLIISPVGQRTPLETSLTIGNMTVSSIRTLITSAYRVGYERVSVHFERQEQFTMLNDIVKNKLIGFEIVHKDAKSCIIENITEPSAEQFDTILRKLTYNITEIFAITESRMRSKKTDDDIEAIEENIQKYDNFCRRVISKRTMFTKRAEMLWAFLTIILHAQRELYHLCKDVKFPVDKSLIDMLLEIKEVFNLVWKAYHERDLRSIELIHERFNTLFYERGQPLLRTLKGESVVALHHLLAALREFYLSTSPLAAYII